MAASGAAPSAASGPAGACVRARSCCPSGPAIVLPLTPMPSRIAGHRTCSPARVGGCRPLQSGTSGHGRPSIGAAGHGRLRQALYLATLSACRYNPVRRTLYQRLRVAGKPMKVERCAAARKLLHLAWAVATKGPPGDPAYAARRTLASTADEAPPARRRRRAQRGGGPERARLGALSTERRPPAPRPARLEPPSRRPSGREQQPGHASVKGGRRPGAQRLHP
jgi:hypothetical protein